MTEKCLTSTDHNRALCAKMYDLQTDGTLCDIQLRIGTNSLYLHSVVLAGCSDTLATELTRDSSDDASCLSHLGVLDGDALQRLIQFLYTGEMLLNGDMDVSAISLCCQHMGLWAGVQLCEAYLKDRDEAATGVVVNYLTHGQNQAMSTDKPGVELVHCRPVTNVAQQNVSIVTDACKFKLHPCHSAETWLQMPANCKKTVPADSGADDQINGRKISETSCVPSVASTGQYKPYKFKFHGSNNTGYVGSYTRDVAEETHSDVDNECCHIDMSTAEKSMVSAAIDVRILCTHATSERGAIRNTNTLRQMEKHGNVKHITRRSSKKLASTSNGDEVVCRRSGRAKHVPKRYSENMAWGVTSGHIGTFGNQCEIDPSQKTTKKIKRGLERDCDIRCKEEHDVGLLGSLNHEPEEKSVSFNNLSQLKSQLQEILESKLTGGNRKTSSTSIEVRTIPCQPVQGRDAITGAEMVESNCDQNNRCESGEVVKPASNSQKGTVMYLRSNSTMQESCNQSLAVLGKLSSDKGNHIDFKCVKETAAAVMESNSFSHAVVIENSSCKIPLEVPPRESDKYKHRKCSICKETFATPDALVTHRKLCHQRARGPNPRNYRCDQCPYMARTEKLLLIHLNNKHDVSLVAQDKFPVHTCHVNGCGYKSLYKQYVWRHHEAQHTGRKFMCEYCGNELRSKVALTLHVRIHLGVKPHVCQICGQAFRQSSILKCHQRSVHETRTHHLLCHECPYTTSNKTSLDLHRYRRHAVALPSNISIYHCDICKFETVSKNTLQCHIRRHLGQRPFECKVCHKTFVSSDDLRGHAVWHLPVSERKYKCPYGVSEDCQYVAATNSKLNSHVRLQHTHKDDRPFTCHVCPYKSGVKGNLTKHLRSVHHIEVTTHQVRVMPYHRDRPTAAVTDPTSTTTAETQGRDTIFRQSDDIQTHTAVSSVLSITE